MKQFSSSVVGVSVVTYSRDILRGKLVGCVGDEQAGLPHRAVTHHHTLYGLHLRKEHVDG